MKYAIRVTTVVLNDTWSPIELSSTVAPQKPNLKQQFLRTAQTPDKQNQSKVPNSIQKFLETREISYFQ